MGLCALPGYDACGKHVGLPFALTGAASGTVGYKQVALQLTGRAPALAANVALPKNDDRGALADVILRETNRCLSVPAAGTARCVQNRARLIRPLYTRLGRLTEPLPTTT